MKKNFLLPIIGFIFILSATMQAQEVIQVKLGKILNARPVTILYKGKPVSWTKGIDGNGEADGYLTMAAAVFMGDINPKALPDNPLIPANSQHPEVLLHYSNNRTSNQAVAVTRSGSFVFEVPAKKYSGMFLAFTSSEGQSEINVILHYKDRDEMKTFTVPDYYLDIPANSPDICYLVHDLAKWGKLNNMTEKDHHNIDLLNISPDSKRTLKSIEVKKSESGYLLLWSATGVSN